MLPGAKSGPPRVQEGRRVSAATFLADDVHMLRHDGKFRHEFWIERMERQLPRAIFQRQRRAQEEVGILFVLVHLGAKAHLARDGEYCAQLPGCDVRVHAGETP